jgi:2-polyprenyl-3-methyl-5-hydroxy-6-metoxy-1,4-benzoquinol methylase
MKLKHINCNLCNENNYKILQTDGPFNVVKCRNCGLIYVNPHPAEERLFNHYNEGYYAPWLKDQHSRRKMWKRRLKKVQHFKSEGRLLDVGCGYGDFLYEARQNDFEVYGTEISKYAVNYAKDNIGIEVFEGVLKEADFADNFFDVVTFWHILEHTTDPLSNLREAGRILKPDGILIVAVPNFQNYIYRIAYTVFKLRPPKFFTQEDRELHLYFFSANTLKKMLEKAGFVPLKFDIDKERIMIRERILDMIALALYKIFRVNFGVALGAYAKKRL